MEEVWAKQLAPWKATCSVTSKDCWTVEAWG
jgi:hypothetical protein